MLHIALIMLQGVSDTIGNVKYSDNNMVQLLLNSVMSYLTQGLTNTALGQMERSTEKSRMTTYVDKESNIPDWMQRVLGKASAKIPIWDFQQTPYLNAWGEEEKNPEGIKNWLYQMLSPSYMDKVNIDKTAEELYRLYEKTGNNVFPQKSADNFTFTDRNGNKVDYRLSAEEADKFYRIEGQTKAEIVADIMNSQDYKALPDAVKEKAINLAYDYATQKARIDVVEGYEGNESSWMKNIEGNEAEKIITKVAYGTVEDAMDMAVESFEYGNTSEAVAALEAAYEVYKSMSIKERKMIMETASGRTEDFLLASAAGIKADTFVKLYEQYNSINKSDMKSAQKAQKWAHALQQAREDNLINDAQLYSLKTNMGISSGFTVEASTYDNLVDIGLDAADADSLSGALSALKPEAGSSSVKTVQKMEAAASATYLTEKERIAAMKTFLTDSQSEKMDKVIKQLGLSAEAYAAIYRTHLEDDKKAEEIQKYVNMGYSTRKGASNLDAPFFVEAAGVDR